MQGPLVLIYFTWFVYLLPRAFSLLCTCPAYNKNGKALARSLFLFSCSLNLITFCMRATFKGAWVNDITKNCSTYRKIPPFVQQFFVYSHMSNRSFLSDKTKSSGKSIEEISFCRSCMEREFWRFDDLRIDLKFGDVRLISAKCLNCLIWLKEFSRIRGKFQKCYLPNISDSKSTFTWDPKWTQTGLKTQTALKACSVYMAIYIKISLHHLSKQWQDPIAHVQMISFN